MAALQVKRALEAPCPDHVARRRDRAGVVLRVLPGHLRTAHPALGRPRPGWSAVIADGFLSSSVTWTSAMKKCCARRTRSGRGRARSLAAWWCRRREPRRRSDRARHRRRRPRPSSPRPMSTGQAAADVIHVRICTSAAAMGVPPPLARAARRTHGDGDVARTAAATSAITTPPGGPRPQVGRSRLSSSCLPPRLPALRAALLLTIPQLGGTTIRRSSDVGVGRVPYHRPHAWSLGARCRAPCSTSRARCSTTPDEVPLQRKV